MQGSGFELKPVGMTDNAQAPWPLHTDRDGQTPRPEYNGCFATSYYWQHLEHSVCLREELQTVQHGINLSQGLGLVSDECGQRFKSESVTYLQNPGPLAFSMYIGARQDCPAVCALQIQLHTKQGERHCTMCDAGWPSSHCLQGAVVHRARCASLYNM